MAFITALKVYYIYNLNLNPTTDNGSDFKLGNCYDLLCMTAKGMMTTRSPR